MGTILDTIVADTKLRIARQMEEIPLGTLIGQVEAMGPARQPKPIFAFERALDGKEIHFICEVKKASPSKGVIREDFPYLEIAQSYEKAGASAISVLTEPHFFQGSSQYLKEIAHAVSIPVLRKDFVVSEYQIYEAKLLGADAVLLICSVLDAKTLQAYRKLADTLGLSCLVEAHTEEEIGMALEAGARLIGVNNRDLKTFTVDLNHSISLRHLVPESIPFVAESGIKTGADIALLQENGVNAVLIGETLMRSGDLAKTLEALRGGGLA